MRRHHLLPRLALAWSLGSGLAGCEPAPPPSPPLAPPAPSPAAAAPDRLATVNGEPVYRAHFDVLLAQQQGHRNPYDAVAATPAPPRTPPATPAERERLLAQLLDIELLAQAAHARGIDSQPDVIAEQALQVKTLLSQHYIEELIATLSVSDDELKALYEQQVPAQGPGRPTLEAARIWLHPRLVHAKVQARLHQLRQRARIELNPSQP